MKTDEEAEKHLSTLLCLKDCYDTAKAALRTEEQRASPNLRALIEAERRHFALMLVYEDMCMETNREDFPTHIWNKYVNSE